MRREEENFIINKKYCYQNNIVLWFFTLNKENLNTYKKNVFYDNFKKLQDIKCNIAILDNFKNLLVAWQQEM